MFKFIAGLFDTNKKEVKRLQEKVESGKNWEKEFKEFKKLDFKKKLKNLKKD